MSDTLLGLICFALTLIFYYASKWLYGKKRILPLMPLLLAPTLLVAVVLLFHIPIRITWRNPTGCSGCWAPPPSPSRCRSTRTASSFVATGCRCR